MSQSEQPLVSVKLTVLQQPNGTQEPQSTASSNGGDAEQQGNGESGSRQSVNVLKGAKTNCRQRMEVALLSIAIVIILMLLLLPTIFYHLPLASVSMFVGCTSTCTS